MFHLMDDMNTASAAAFLKAAGNRFVAHAAKAARNDVLAKKNLQIPWDDGMPTLDLRNEQDGKARGDKELKERGEGTETESTSTGFPVPMPAIKRCAICVALVDLTRQELAAYTNAQFDQPQTYEGYVKYMATRDKPFPVTEEEKQKDQALIDAGLITAEDAAIDRIKQVDRLAAPYRQYGSEILQTIHELEKAPVLDVAPSFNLFDELPYWERLQLIEETAAAMFKVAQQKALQSRRTRYGVGVDTEELVHDALLIQKDVERVRKYRVEFFKLHKQDLEREDEIRQRSRELPQ